MHIYKATVWPMYHTISLKSDSDSYNTPNQNMNFDTENWFCSLPEYSIILHDVQIQKITI
jgi:hypothetical protein